MKNILVGKFDVIRRRKPNEVAIGMLVGILIIVALAVFSVYSGNTNFQSDLQTPEDLSITEPNTVTVERGEGLWQIAQRVCGDGHFYDQVAKENGLAINSSLETGQVLKVTCAAYVRSN